jgi:hypothetical protein
MKVNLFFKLKMEQPQQLSDYFNIVSDFLDKTFRDDAKLFVSVKSSQRSTMQFFETNQADQLVPTPRKKKAEAEEGDKKTPATGTTIHTVRFTPRMVLRNDGTSYGKLKLGCRADISNVCNLYQRMLIGTDGLTTFAMDVDNLVDGLQLKSKLSVNTIETANDDCTSAELKYKRKDFYVNCLVSRYGDGGVLKDFDFGARFYSLLAGFGFRNFQRPWSNDGIPAEDVDYIGATRNNRLFVGGGYSGTDWTFGGQLVRTDDAWCVAELALYHKVCANTSLACRYELDILGAVARLCIAFSQGIKVPLPSALGGGTLPFVAAIKSESDGSVSGTLRGRVGRMMQWGIVARKNVMHHGSSPRFGFLVSLDNGED